MSMGRNNPIKHPQGRLIAIQEQIHRAESVSHEFDMMPEFLLKALSASGMMLTPDINEIAVDAFQVASREAERRYYKGYGV